MGKTTDKLTAIVLDQLRLSGTMANETNMSQFLETNQKLQELISHGFFFDEPESMPEPMPVAPTVKAPAPVPKSPAPTPAPYVATTSNVHRKFIIKNTTEDVTQDRRDREVATFFDKTVTSHAANNEMTVQFSQSISGGQLRLENGEMVSVREKWVRTHHLEHGDIIDIKAGYADEPTFLRLVRHTKWFNRYKDITVDVKRDSTTNEFYADSDIRGFDMMGLINQERYVIPENYSEATHLAVGDVLTIRVNTQNTEQIRCVWLEYGPNHESYGR